ncbi:CAAX prenyl protease-like protein [Thermosediminibacter litoriperuensis]|uniref:CAAX prenyl protease-like protein n=1 Tax=Thermosediminibacter litoriperuensis TaxID=291989 RepID=A0A5S5AZ84_9FIRM|nr:CAAX prenyl protease-like protein [Thermosediminibacter litoriperuensis]
MLHFYKRLRETPLLLGYIIVELAVTFGLDGFWRLSIGLINLFLLLIWALIIRIMTADSSETVKINNPKLELCVGVVFLIYFYIIRTLLDFYRKYIFYDNRVAVFIESFLQNIFPGDSGYITNSIMNAGINTIVMTVPLLLIYKFMGYKYIKMGFRDRYWKLTFVLLGVSFLLNDLAYRIHHAIGFFEYEGFVVPFISFIIGLFISLPIELFFRGFLLPRLEVLVKNPLNALVISSIIFSVGYIPFWQIQQSYGLLRALLSVFSFGRQPTPTGLIWGYLYLRTRSVIPCIMWHAWALTFGRIFL